jgi:hypothetical protein
MKKIIFTALLSLSVLGCKNMTSEISGGNETEKQHEFTAATLIEQAHQKDLFNAAGGVYFDINIQFNGKERLNGLVLINTSTSAVHLNLSDGGSIIYDGGKVWSDMDAQKDSQARFDVLTWSYFFTLPYKLSDPGVTLTSEIFNSNHEKYRLSFENGTGDSPDDWYDIFINQNTQLIDYAGYIVTYAGVDPVKAEETAHAISYEDYKLVDSIPISHEWKFYNYDGTAASKGKVIGRAVISNIKTGKIDARKFAKFEGMHEVLLPVD